MVEEEEKKTENETKEEVGKPEDTGEGNKPKTPTLYERTNAAAERVEKANAKTEENLNRQEELYEKQKLGGTTEAGQPAEKPKEPTDDELMEKFQHGELKIFD